MGLYNPTKGYRVVLADPAWLMDLYSEAGATSSPQAHYNCSPTPAICAFMAQMLTFACAEDCVLIMWCTFPMLARGDCHEVMRAAGFEPKTGGAWVKTTRNGKLCFGGGYIYRSAAECWLLGTRGNPKAYSKSIRNAIVDLRREHSRKPDVMYDMIENQFKGPYLELNARTERPGWDWHGDETKKFATPLTPIAPLA